jgi:hypothetical protein
MHFFIKLREDELSLLKKVKEFFNCGGIYYQKEYRVNQRACYRFGITAQKDLHEKVIPFFDKNPLKSQKLKNYLLFRQIALMVKNKEGLARCGKSACLVGTRNNSSYRNPPVKAVKSVIIEYPLLGVEIKIGDKA